ncbi:MAG TPA: DUF4258 domain-containing protein [Thermomicrobiales bacterium]|nr:DUF4258 domain-containing protein [Thermomicrobiales bacterium]
MPIFDKIVYTIHAQERMAERRIRHDDVEFALRHGEGRPGKSGSWIIESGRYRIVIVEEGTTARVLTVVRLRGKR